jgi:hypothetical protein
MTHMNSTIKYPNIVVDLSTIDGNAFSVMGAVTRAMKKHGLPTSEVDAYRKEAMSGNYNDLLTVTMNWVAVDYSNDCLMADEDYDDLDYDDDNY